MHHEHHSRVISPSWGWHLLLFSQSPHDHRPWLRDRDSDAVVPSPKIPDSIYAGSDQIGGRGTKRNDQMGRRGHRLDARRMVVGNDQIGPRTPLPCSSVHPPTAYNADFKSRQHFFVILLFSFSQKCYFSACFAIFGWNCFGWRAACETIAILQNARWC